jgi:SAM-dependent methyltransferase
VSVIEHVPGDGDSAMVREIARILRPGGIAALTFPFRAEYAEEHVTHDLYGQRYEGEPLFFYRHYDAGAVQRRLLDPADLEVIERTVWAKGGVRETADAARRIVPARLGLGRALGPALILVGKRAMHRTQESDLALDNVMGLVLRRRPEPEA